MFSDIGEVVAYAKRRMPLVEVVKAHLMGDRGASRAILLESTIKAALAASLWNQSTALENAVETVKAGKKTMLVKAWLTTTAKFMGTLPVNESGDITRITNPTKFINGCNAAVTAWNSEWSAFEQQQAAKQAAQRASKPAKEETAPAAVEVEIIRDFDGSSLHAEMRDSIAQATEELSQEKSRSASALRVAREKDQALATANARIQELEILLSASEESKNFLQHQLQMAVAEIQMLRNAASTPTRKTRAKKEVTTTT